MTVFCNAWELPCDSSQPLELVLLALLEVEVEVEERIHA
jgi:hypothetical protein